MSNEKTSPCCMLHAQPVAAGPPGAAKKGSSRAARGSQGEQQPGRQGQPRRAAAGPPGAAKEGSSRTARGAAKKSSSRAAKSSSWAARGSQGEQRPGRGREDITHRKITTTVSPKQKEIPLYDSKGLHCCIYCILRGNKRDHGRLHISE
jgi:hypothetical protein